ncbi:hypothetical protein EDC39_103246 [Geothermobacter ehrlichii]|uniref:Uncharacterized protein n=1 Tax=Geothermobacter ehrlichii TaxID=213224 RepID=A0A5D3WL64_9BACT|nr:hypothetical protein [Geothermobacter ehrlichii]TYO99400.1 hypothetical protein EDC39_103246 [Geothermobacter ehrlichii]
MAWHRQYIDAIIQRDVQEVTDVDKLDLLPRFVQALAQVSGQLRNYSRLGIVLYDGSETMPLGDRLWAAPLSSLWGG